MRSLNPVGVFWLGYFGAGLMAIVWLAFWVCGGEARSDEVAQPVDDTPLSVCGTDWECELYDRRDRVAL